mmetsp:Transcript_29116/g.67514  ORF Transcript_29116/g.67514 Transcript_29116/m.67514 type:complete len:188 (-) Transcript_29116:919-1482(-)
MRNKLATSSMGTNSMAAHSELTKHNQKASAVEEDTVGVTEEVEDTGVAVDTAMDTVGVTEEVVAMVAEEEGEAAVDIMIAVAMVEEVDTMIVEATEVVVEEDTVVTAVDTTIGAGTEGEVEDMGAVATVMVVVSAFMKAGSGHMSWCFWLCGLRLLTSDALVGYGGGYDDRGGYGGGGGGGGYGDRY